MGGKSSCDSSQQHRGDWVVINAARRAAHGQKLTLANTALLPIRQPRFSLFPSPLIKRFDESALGTWNVLTFLGSRNDLMVIGVRFLQEIAPEVELESD